MIATIFGKHGDILWTLPAVRELSREHGRIDLVIGGEFERLITLLQFQEYIRSVRALTTWRDFRELPPGVEDALHLGDCIYRTAGYSPNTPLVDIFLSVAGITHWNDRTPFLTAPKFPTRIASPLHPLVTIGFGDNYTRDVPDLIAQLQLEVPEVTVVNLREHSWIGAASIVREAVVHLGNRSALTVMAHGLGKPVVCYERFEAARVPIYSYPYGDEELVVDPQTAVEAVRERVRA